MIKIFKKIILGFLRASGHILPNIYPHKTKILSERGKHIFFGYYDVTCFHPNGTKILAMRVTLKNISPHKSNPEMDIGFYDTKNYIFKKVAKSHAWNWQQGCRLQWFDDNSIIYNDYHDGAFVTHRLYLDGKNHLQTYSMPYYTISPNKDFALGLDFFRLHKNRPGYGYNNPSHEQFDSKNAVYKIDFITGYIVNLLQYKDIDDIIGFSDCDNFYINHLSISPDGKFFVFFYITVKNNVRKIYLMMADQEGKHLKCLSKEWSPSHFTWKNRNEILLTLATKKRETNYAIFNVENYSYRSLDTNLLNVDGHPTYISDETFISDTYPSRFGFQKLFYYNENTKIKKDLASFYLPPNYMGEVRCDLHPRVSPDKKNVCVDVVANGNRAMAIIPVKDR